MNVNKKNIYILSPCNMDLDKIEYLAADTRNKIEKIEIDGKQWDLGNYDLTKEKINVKKFFFETYAEEIIKSKNKKANIKINFEDEKLKTSGRLIVKKGNDIHISINKSEAFGRKVFTLFHEVGHYILHVVDNKEAMEHPHVEEHRQGVDFLQKEANRFSANLIVGIRSLINILKKKADISQENNNFSCDILQLANIFSVSVATIDYQIKNHMKDIKEALF